MRPEPRRGFRRERHTALKVAVCLLAAAGFLAAWGGLGASHEQSSPPARSRLRPPPAWRPPPQHPIRQASRRLRPPALALPGAPE
jgi:hypothetical protein